MSRKQIIGLVLIALAVVVCVLTGGRERVDLLVSEISGRTSLVHLGYVALGVVIGILLHK